ncbi:MAG: PucR family transcriptional regulator ligand-binding domain-containing protein [bacterium]|nr:PucR family transcriptional regulator ligand-binding domain-containing protein [bacterium]
MGVMLKKLVQQVSHMEMKLVAGEKGLTNEVNWMHMVDSEAVSEFLVGGELVFTTGVGLNERLSLFQLVQKIYKCGASGIVINIGPYISEISEDIIAFANQHGFPVFEVPWKVHMAEIMRIYSFAITKEEQNELELSAAVSNAFRCPAQEELYVSTLMQKGFLVDWKYDIGVVKINKAGKPIADYELGPISSRLNSHLQFQYSGVICCALEGRIALILANYSKEKRNEMLKEVFSYLRSTLKPGEEVLMCAGSSVSRLNAIHISYKQAEKMTALIANYELPGEIVSEGAAGEKHKLLFFEDMGMMRLIITITDRSALQEYVDDTVAPLYEYDRVHQGDIVKTMQSYLKHNGSVKEVAEEMIVHRNTVNYKIKKVEEILGKDMSEYEARFQISLGFMALQILKNVL